MNELYPRVQVYLVTEQVVNLYSQAQLNAKVQVHSGTLVPLSALEHYVILQLQ